MEKVEICVEVRKLSYRLNNNGCVTSVLTTMNCVKEKSITLDNSVVKRSLWTMHVPSFVSSGDTKIY